jgi:murein DD-endopeptidase MepM/ murein hydrolase activator NlpD
MRNRLAIGVISLLGFLACSGCFQAAKTHTIRIDSHPRPTADFVDPLKKSKVLSRFGPRSGWYHTGIDLRVKRGGGDVVGAARAGTVISAITMNGYGRIVSVKHSDGFITRYAHLKKILVRKGQSVELLTPIGLVGATGRAETPHLHFEILTNEGRFVDPAPLIFKTTYK